MNFMDNYQKTLIFCGLNYLLKDNDDNNIETKRFHQYILALYLIIHYSPYRNIHSTIHMNNIQQGNADFLFENIDNQTLKKITRLN
jgi:hypothetical protein